MKTIDRKYEFAVNATDVVIFTVKDNKLQVLLIKMKKQPFNKCWALPGGLVRINETLDASASRQLFLKTGLKNVYLEQLYTFGDVKRDPFGRVVSTAYFALISDLSQPLKTSEDYSEVKWFPIERLPVLAYDHDKIIKVAFERMKAKLEYTNIVCNLLPEQFTLTDLQKAYEIILKKKLDKRNFRKKINSLKMIKSTGKKVTGERSRPAALYQFIKKTPEIIQIL